MGSIRGRSTVSGITGKSTTARIGFLFLAMIRLELPGADRQGRGRGDLDSVSLEKVMGEGGPLQGARGFPRPRTSARPRARPAIRTPGRPAGGPRAAGHHLDVWGEFTGAREDADEGEGRGRPEGREQVVPRVQDPPRVRHQPLTLKGQRDLPGGPYEESGVQLLLQAPMSRLSACCAS